MMKIADNLQAYLQLQNLTALCWSL